MTRSRSPLPIRLAIGAAAGAALVLGVPLAASAHVEVDPTDAPAGATTPLTFGFHHGCDDSPTRSLTITIPDGVGNATPVYQGGWSIQRTLGDNGVPTSITFTADSPVETGIAASVSLDVLFDTSAKGTTLAFPVEQTCVSGSTSWSEVPAKGQTRDDLDTPAPTVTVGAADAAAEAPAAATADPLARWLAGGGLVAGVAGLVVALIGRGRRRQMR
ncbi:DUF1775 domain-containing protein [Microbacterium protaetiae]|uniref:DUF1775 domain-containing protein n=1 Tax=Microbacterium protaetiae TaxID=2509458 RepID=A0A4V0YCX0_9MICO|nr:DUF1775 domain-containing protein [Microbacterium protaetiae]QAY58681.1 DUF1775 domain-containing protein [Microbacterium protaetiae]